MSSRLPLYGADEQADLAVLPGGHGQQLGPGGVHGPAVAQLQAHQTAFGLVGDGGVAEL